MNTADRRSVRTERMLQQALTELLADKELKNISIRELTERADVNRSTFYAHYQDLYQLYDQMLKEYFAEVHKIVDIDYNGNLSECYRALLEFAYDNKKISTIVLNDEQHFRVFREASSILEDSCTKYWCKITGRKEIPEELREYVNYHVAGCFMMVSDICRNGFSISAEAAAGLITAADENMARFIVEESRKL